MLRTRVIPCLLLRRGGLVKTIGFANPKYVGDPINSVKIFNEKEVDELILLDVHASKQGAEPDYDLLADITGEAFLPIAYGGGVRSAEQARRLVGLGIEKIILNSAVLRDTGLVRKVADTLGSSSTLVAVDVKRNWRGKPRVYDASSGRLTSLDPVDHIKAAVANGAGEIFINDVQRDGTGRGLDLEMVAAVADAIRVPLIACGGAGNHQHLRAAANAGASAVAAGSLFVYMGRHRAVMINYPPYAALEALFA